MFDHLVGVVAEEAARELPHQVREHGTCPAQAPRPFGRHEDRPRLERVLDPQVILPQEPERRFFEDLRVPRHEVQQLPVELAERRLSADQLRELRHASPLRSRVARTPPRAPRVMAGRSGIGSAPIRTRYLRSPSAITSGASIITH